MDEYFLSYIQMLFFALNQPHTRRKYGVLASVDSAMNIFHSPLKQRDCKELSFFTVPFFLPEVDKSGYLLHNIN